MAENLKYLPSVNGSGESSGLHIIMFTIIIVIILKMPKQQKIMLLMEYYIMDSAPDLAQQVGIYQVMKWTILTDYLDENAGGKLKNKDMIIGKVKYRC